jgi:RES domain
MPSATWTPAALSSEQRPLSGTCWRTVEAQHRVSTMKLVDTLAEQSLLESIIDEAKPPVPVECRQLHYLLSTPFRYAPYPAGSRFRRSGVTPGVCYGSARPETAVAEMAFHRLLFYADSPGTPWPVNAGEYTVFSARYRSASGLDLTAPRLDRDRARWTDPSDYGACQDLAERARSIGVEVLRYESARVTGAVNVAVMACRAFRSREPVERQTWRLHLGPHGVKAVCDFPATRLEFDRGAFAADLRIAGLTWERA